MGIHRLGLQYIRWYRILMNTNPLSRSVVVDAPIVITLATRCVTADNPSPIGVACSSQRSPNCTDPDPEGIGAK